MLGAVAVAPGVASAVAPHAMCFVASRVAWPVASAAARIVAVPAAAPAVLRRGAAEMQPRSAVRGDALGSRAVSSQRTVVGSASRTGSHRLEVLVVRTRSAAPGAPRACPAGLGEQPEYSEQPGAASLGAASRLPPTWRSASRTSPPQPAPPRLPRAKLARTASSEVARTLRPESAPRSALRQSARSAVRILPRSSSRPRV
jgi:hypothetical protein